MAVRVLVLGGNGFIGRHTVTALQALGAEVSIGSRKASAPEAQTSGLGAQQDAHHDQPAVLALRLQHMTSAEDWQPYLDAFDVVINSVGILRQRPGETYEVIHHLAPAALAAACARSATRLVHVSALGLDPGARSRFLSSKVAGERAIEAAQGDWFLARLSLLDGDGGYGASWLRGVAKLPVFLAPTSAVGEIAALTASDAGEALARLALQPSAELTRAHGRIFELGGERTYRFAEYIQGLSRRYRSQPASPLRVPGILARGFAHLCDLLHFSPFSFGHWELLCSDNVPRPNRLRELLGRAPQAVLSD